MTREQLQMALRLQSVAYRLLLWLNEQARRQPARLSAEQVERIGLSASCLDWLREVRGQLPRELRVEPAEADALAHLVASFLRTSFERKMVRTEWQGPLVPQLKPIAGRLQRHGRSAKRRNQAEAAALMRIALEELAEASGVSPTPAVIDAVLNDAALYDDLNLWSYACELVRRTQFASQGPAVHYMWRQIALDQRRQLSDRAIWDARSRLLAALQQYATQKPD